MWDDVFPHTKLLLRPGMDVNVNGQVSRFVEFVELRTMMKAVKGCCGI